VVIEKTRKNKGKTREKPEQNQGKIKENRGHH